MGIHNASQKVVNSVNAALSFQTTKGTPGGAEYFWYLPYNITLNNLVCKSETITVNTQHRLDYIHKNGKPSMYFPDFAIVRVSPPTAQDGIFETHVLAVVEIKPLNDKIHLSRAETDEEGKRAIFIREALEFAEKQAYCQAQAVLAKDYRQNKIIGVLAVGQYWAIKVYIRTGYPCTQNKNLPGLDSPLDFPIWSLVDPANPLKHSEEGLANLHEALVTHFDIK